MDTQTGKFVVGSKPLTTVTEGMVNQRAKEIAVINGRNGNEFTRRMNMSRRGGSWSVFQRRRRRSLKAQAPDTGEWLGEAGDRGQKAPVRPAKDEQTFAEDLVKEGVEEATHDTMLAEASEARARIKLRS